ncbi:hypothetical protein RKD29_003411 [Streptomyces tendae]|uniref:DUF397 domain-containing protein n=1 Tax=Streptomyces tendae TaxID=1932 RepID=UPI00383609DC
MGEQAGFGLVEDAPADSDGPEGDSCVETATAPRAIHVRDSKHTAGARLGLAPGAWASFVTYAASAH